MSSKSRCTALAIAVFMTMAGQTGVATAHSLNGTLGKAVGATDLHQITCSDGSGRLAVEVMDVAPVAGPLVSVQVLKGSMANNSTDRKDGDANYSPTIHTYGGDGPYYMLINKSGPGSEIYAVEYHCETANGDEHTGTSSFLLQDQ